MRRHFAFDCDGAACAATLDLPNAAGNTALLIVSGGNEIRSGAHRGQVQLAEAMASRGHSVMRYDRRGIGDSDGANTGWRGAAGDLAVAAAALRSELPGAARIVGFGNCDGAAALLLFGRAAGIERIVAANPWSYDHDGESEADPAPEATAPDAAHAKAHYLARLSNPATLVRDLMSGGIDIGKAVRGVGAILKGEQPSATGARLARAFGEWGEDAALLLSGGDRTAIHFEGQMKLAKARLSPLRLLGGSHSFAAPAERNWLYAQVADALER